MQKNKHFRKNYFTYFLRLGLIISGSVHLLTVGTLFGMNVLFFEQPKEDEESNEFEMLEQQSIEINALSADEVRALIAALEGKTSEASEGDSIPAGGEEVSEDRQSDGEEVQEEQTASIESVETESISEVVQDAVEEQPAPELSVEKDTPPEPEPVPEPEKVVEAPQEPEPVQEITEVTKPEASEELQQKTEEERKKRLLKSVLAEEVEEIEVLSESEEIGTEPETLMGEEEPPQIIEELEGQQELLSKPLENLLDEDVDTMELAELDSSSNQLETGVSSTLEEFSNSEASLSNLTESALKELDNRSLFDAPELETVKVSTNSLDSLNPAESTLEPDTTQSLRESTTRLKQQVQYSEKESSVLDRAKPEREEGSVNDPVEEQTIVAVVESPETRFETNRSPQTQTEENVSMSALKSTQPADEPTKIQTASGLVKIERKTLSSDVSVSEDAKESSPAPKPTLVQASKPKAKPVQA